MGTQSALRFGGAQPKAECLLNQGVPEVRSILGMKENSEMMLAALKREAEK